MTTSQGSHAFGRSTSSPFFLFLLFASTIGPLLFGYHLAELNAPQDVLTCAKASIAAKVASSLPQCLPMNEAQIGIVNSIFTIGGLGGALSAGYASSKYGRLPTMRWATGFLIVGPIPEALAPSVAILALGRLISGIGAGAALVAIPIYVSEIAPPASKGFYGAFSQIMVNVGIFSAQLLGLFLSRDQFWRIILGVAGLFGAMQLLALVFAVESPKWTASQGQMIRAKKILRRIRGSEYDIKEEVNGWKLPSEEDREGEEQALLADEDDAVGSSNAQPPRKRDFLESSTVGMFDVLLYPRYNRATLAVMIVMVAQQLCGINSIIFYGVTLLSDLLAASSALLNVFVAVVCGLATLLAARLIDRLGRKVCLILSIAGMGISSVLLAIAIIVHIAALSVVAVITFVASFGLGLGPIPFIIASELVGPEAVGATQGWALTANWISTFVVSFLFPILNSALGKGKVYFIFAAFAALFGALTVWFVPETKGKKDADEVWGRTSESPD